MPRIVPLSRWSHHDLATTPPGDPRDADDPVALWHAHLAAGRLIRPRTPAPTAESAR